MSRRIARRKISLKYCGCPLDAPTDCRYHGMSEKGWEVCPNHKNTGGRILWGTGYQDIDSGEVFHSLKDVADAVLQDEENSEEGQQELQAA